MQAEQPVPDYPTPLKGILLKVASVTVFLCMSALIKAAGKDIAPGQITFLRSAFAIPPIVAVLALQGQLRGAWRTDKPMSHLLRGFVGILSMGFSFYGLVHLPLPEAIAIGYAMPLIAVIVAALVLKEAVGPYRWGAVLVGLSGVMVIVWPRLTLFRTGGAGSAEALGAVSLLVAATLAACAMVLVRKLVRTERTSTIVLYFSLSASVFSLATLPFGWSALSPMAFLLLALSGVCGGVGQLLLTASYRYAAVSTIAPFEYVSIALGIVAGYVLFGDVPTVPMLAGTALVVIAGIVVILREHRLGLRRRQVAAQT